MNISLRDRLGHPSIYLDGQPTKNGRSHFLYTERDNEKEIKSAYNCVKCA